MLFASSNCFRVQTEMEPYSPNTVIVTISIYWRYFQTPVSHHQKCTEPQPS